MLTSITGKRIIPFAFILTTFFFGPEVTANETIRACFENWSPYYEVTTDGRVKGPVFEIIDRIAAEINVTVEYSELPYKRCLSEVRNNQFDMILLSSPGVAGIVESKTPLAYWNLMAVVKKDALDKEFDEMLQFRGRNVGTYAGYLYPPIISNSRSQWATETIVNYNEKTDGDQLRIFRLIEQGRIDVAFLDLAWLHSILAKTTLKVKILRPPVHSDPSMIGYAPNSKKTTRLFEERLAQLSRSGELDFLYKSRLGIPLSAF